MKKIIKIILLFSLFFLRNHSYSQSQLTFDYQSTSDKFKLGGMEIYFVIGEDSLYLTKTDKYKFQFDPNWVKESGNGISEEIEVVIQTCKYIYSFKKMKTFFYSSQYFWISFYRFKDGVENATLRGESTASPSILKKTKRKCRR